MVDLQYAIDSQPLWYHTLELSPGVVTPGWFDLRPIVDRMPWPDVTRKRCLDVATYDGFLAFELERRGAAEVVATDIAGHEQWDWLPRDAAKGPEYLASVAGEKGRGFEVAAEALGSSVRREFVNVYDLDRSKIGGFDVVVCGSLLLHLRDPFRALAAIKGVCDGVFLSAEQIDVGLSVLERRRPSFHLEGRDGQWLVPNRRGHLEMLRVAGFDLVDPGAMYAIPLGAGHRSSPSSARATLRKAARRVVVGGAGVPMSAALVRSN